MSTTNYNAAVDTNDLIMSYMHEAVWGVTPTVTSNNPKWQNLRLDSEGFSGSKSRTRPNEIDPSGQASSALSTKEEATGSLNFSVSAGETSNTLLAASMAGVWTENKIYTASSTNFVVSASNPAAKTCTLTCTGATFTTTTPAYVGQRVRVVVVGATTDEFTATVGTVTSATALALIDCVGVYADLTSSSNSYIYSLGTFFSADGTSFAITSSSGSTCTLTATGATFQTADTSSFLVLGQFIKLHSAGTAAHRWIGRVAEVTSDTTIKLDCISGTPTDDAAFDAGVTSIRGSMLRNGTTVNTFTFQKKLASSLFLRYTGSYPTGGSLDVGTGDYLKGTMSFLCKSETSSTSEVTGCTASSGATENGYSFAPTKTVIDSIEGIGTVWRGSGTATPAALSGTVQKIGIKWNQEGAASQYGMGSAAALGMRRGKILVTGTLSTYFLNFTLYNEYITETSGPISFYALDGQPSASTTSGYVFTFCNATIMNPKIVAGGPGQDVMADFEIEGSPDNTAGQIFGGKTIQFDYFV